MNDRRLARAVLATFAAVSLACNGIGTRQSTSPRASTGQASATDPDTAVIAMTGLILVVPPIHAGDSTYLVLPKPSAGDPHNGWFVFGVPRGAKRMGELCETVFAGACWVDLEKWSLGVIGSGGTEPVDMEEYGALNVTRGSGGRRVNFSPDAEKQTIVLAGGQVRNESCRRAVWSFRAFDPTEGPHKPDTLGLANVLRWQIMLPQGMPLQLVFSHLGTSIPVQLTAGTSHKIEVFLAHIPLGTIRALQAGTLTENKPQDGAPAEHFDSYYNALTGLIEVAKNDPRRPVPHFVRATGEDCRVPITISARHNQMGPLNVGTYACMVASATP